MDFPTAHALLRDRRHWSGEHTGLATDREGDLLLARIPAPADGESIDVATSLPYARAVSGIAAGPCGAIFIADTANDAVVYYDVACDTETRLPFGGWASHAPGHFRSPRGLAAAFDGLLVADTGNSRVQRLAFPALEAHLAFEGWATPLSVAVDHENRILVIDGAAHRVHRLVLRSPDAPFGASIHAQAKLQKPLFIACDSQNRVLVSDAGANEVFVFDDNGQFSLALPGPAGWMPGAIAVDGDRVYAADAASGSILVFEHDVSLGRIDGWHGPVTALAAAADGTLYIKPGLDAKYYRFEAGGAFVRTGELIAGPFDAGEEREWLRAWAEAAVPAETSLTVDVALQHSPSQPTTAEWISLPSVDALLHTVGSAGRFGWLRLVLSTTSRLHSPRVSQARLATAAEDLRQFLPLAYTRADRENGFLSRWLQLVRGEFGRIEEWLDDMPRVADPQFARAAALPWLAQWLSFELPQIASDEERRLLLSRAARLFQRRGTPASLAEFIELHTGIRPAIVESFRDRRIWSLEAASRLGFDTRLAPLDPAGMIVPDTGAEHDCCSGAPSTRDGRAPCGSATVGVAPTPQLRPGPIGRVVVGESGPLAEHQGGMPLFASDAYRFCVIVDGYRAEAAAVRDEIARIVEREKPAHTDYRIDYVAPQLRVGMQAHVGVDTIVGGDPPALRLDRTEVGVTTWLPTTDVPRAGMSHLDGTLTLT